MISKVVADLFFFLFGVAVAVAWWISGCDVVWSVLCAV